MRTIYVIGIAVGLTMLAWSCGNSKKTDVRKTEVSLRPLINDPNADLQKFFFGFVEEQATDSSKVYVVKSLYESDTVGLKIEVINHIPAGITAEGTPDEDNGFVKGAIKISSIGEESDQFVSALQKIFNIDGTGKMSPNVLNPLVFSSNNVVVDLDKSSTYSFKLFIDNPKGQEAEIFAVIDTYRKSFELSEINDTFREQIIASLEAE